MYREVSPVEIREVLRQRQRGRSQREVARALHLDRKTVRRYEELAVAAGFELAGEGVQSAWRRRWQSVSSPVVARGPGTGSAGRR